MPSPKIGLQLIVYGKRVQEDLAGVLEEVARAGYSGIEAGNIARVLGLDTVRRCLAETGLALAGAHVSYDDVCDPQKLRAALEFTRALEGSYLACSGVGQVKGIHTYDDAADTFNVAGRICREHGIPFCYHNHAWEFEDLDGEKGIHRLIARTDPQLVRLCVDVYWVHIGGEDPAEFIRRYADRIECYHAKDGAKGSFCELGAGTVPLPPAVQAALATNPEWLVYEQDRTDKTPEQSAIQSRQYLRDTFGI